MLPASSLKHVCVCIVFSPANNLDELFAEANEDQSEKGRTRFRRVRFQTPISVRCFALTEFRGENTVSSDYLFEK